MITLCKGVRLSQWDIHDLRAVLRKHEPVTPEVVDLARTLATLPPDVPLITPEGRVLPHGHTLRLTWQYEARKVLEAP